MSLLPLLLGPVARIAASVARRPAAAVATVLHRAGALPRNRGLERLVVGDDDTLAGRGGGCIGQLVVGVIRCLC